MVSFIHGVGNLILEISATATEQEAILSFVSWWFGNFLETMWSRFNAVKQLLSNNVIVLLIKAECRAEVEKKLTLCQELTLLE